MSAFRQTSLRRSRRPGGRSRLARAFTLIELLVVMAIIVILVTITIPAVKSLSKSNGSAQATNLVRAMLANARAIAISQHRQAGVVFFEETKNSTIIHSGQTAMQLIVEGYGQTATQFIDPILKTSPLKGTFNTVFFAYSSDRQYLAPNIQVATLNDDPANAVLTGDTSLATIPKSRVILFDYSGQLVLRQGLAAPTPTIDPTYQGYADWQLLLPTGTPASSSVSVPGVFIYDQSDYKNYVLANNPDDPHKALWVEQHADVILINAYTGGVIR